MSADHMAVAAAALKAMPGVIAANVKTIPLASSSAAPTAEGGVDGPLAC